MNSNRVAQRENLSAILKHCLLCFQIIFCPFEGIFISADLFEPQLTSKEPEVLNLILKRELPVRRANRNRKSLSLTKL